MMSSRADKLRSMFKAVKKQLDELDGDEERGFDIIAQAVVQAFDILQEKSS